MITLSLSSALYIVLIAAIIILTIYLAVTLTKLNSVLNDVRQVTHLLSTLTQSIEKFGGKIVPALAALVAVVEKVAKDKKQADSKKKK